MHRHLPLLTLLVLFPNFAFATVYTGPTWLKVLANALPFIIIAALAALGFWAPGWKKLLWGLAAYLLIGASLLVYTIGFAVEPEAIEFILAWPLWLFVTIF